ncbi:unnamed protein product [Penicillium salamii]|uniref:Calcofluor white hypersensitive protein n=1 Tax=Penicillium salamii TaxID=1612424 RepID=A0A9W4JU01_9EURO|nr:unnamed protein product [Penicillium salamii]CAG8194412.1 unnamed protein product [Penicillium salamii]CAG8307380.1 unnamed protein product [Penicillium salamii]CAG8360259.1 unnamed protein product [Penicillium salamii]CAG8406117.1 unnamed protein product [Penicillium salamii]
MPLMLGFAAAGAGGYYLYSAGGDPEAAKNKMKIDAEKAREKLPSTDSAEKYGKDLGKEAGSTVDDAVARARAEGKKIPEFAQEGKDKLDGLRGDAKDRLSAGLDKLNSGVDQVDRDVEKKAAEAKGAVSGWFGKK